MSFVEFQILHILGCLFFLFLGEPLISDEWYKKNYSLNYKYDVIFTIIVDILCVIGIIYCIIGKYFYIIELILLNLSIVHHGILNYLFMKLKKRKNRL